MTAETSPAVPAAGSDDAHIQASITPNVSAGHDADMTASFAAVVSAQGDVKVKQSGAAAMMAQRNVSIEQGGAGIIVGQGVSGDTFGAAAVVATEAKFQKSWVGMAISPKLEISDDSRVFIGTKAAIIIAVAIFGVFGIFAVLAYYGARRAMRWRPTLPIPSFSWRRLGQ